MVGRSLRLGCGGPVLRHFNSGKILSRCFYLSEYPRIERLPTYLVTRYPVRLLGFYCLFSLSYFYSRRGDGLGARDYGPGVWPFLLDPFKG